MASDGITTLAEALAARSDIPFLRIGTVSAVSKSGSVWTIDLTVDGGSGTRRARWNGSGSQPQVGQTVFYLDVSPIPMVMGRVSNDSEDQHYGQGTVNAASYVDNEGAVAPRITTARNIGTAAQSSATAAQSSANIGISIGNTAQSRADYGVSQASIGINVGNSAQGTANQALSSANAAQGTANEARNVAYDARNTANNAQSRINDVNSYAYSIERSLINLYNQHNALNSYAVSIENSLIWHINNGGHHGH